MTQNLAAQVSKEQQDVLTLQSSIASAVQQEHNDYVSLSSVLAIASEKERTDNEAVVASIASLNSLLVADVASLNSSISSNYSSLHQNIVDLSNNAFSAIAEAKQQEQSDYISLSLLPLQLLVKKNKMIMTH